jgi:hypothetical protein
MSSQEADSFEIPIRLGASLVFSEVISTETASSACQFNKQAGLRRIARRATCTSQLFTIGIGDSAYYVTQQSIDTERHPL